MELVRGLLASGAGVRPDDCGIMATYRKQVRRWRLCPQHSPQLLRSVAALGGNLGPAVCRHPGRHAARRCRRHRSACMCSAMLSVARAALAVRGQGAFGPALYCRFVMQSVPRSLKYTSVPQVQKIRLLLRERGLGAIRVRRPWRAAARSPCSSAAAATAAAAASPL